MNRIDAIFQDLRSRDARALMPFVTAGYPDLATTAALLPAIDRGGASICELGIPFSDPIADGPVIQSSMSRALEAGVHPADVFEMVRSLRPKLTMGLVAMVSYSIVYRQGVERFVGEAAEAGFDGFIFPDLPVEEAPAVARLVAEAELTSSLLIAPTTPDDRAQRIARASSGFIYMLARTGITGARSDLPAGLDERVARLRGVSELPVAIGFGISKPEHVRAVTTVADAAIVGSALVREIGQRAGVSPSELAGHVESFVAELAGGLHRAEATSEPG